MSARIDIVNFALGILGEGAITDLKDDSDKARTMDTFYFIARDGTLEEAEWSFATRRFLPPKNEAAPEWGWSNSFPLPSDIIRLTQCDRSWIASTIPENDMDRNPAPHVVEGREILTNEDVIYCKGIRRIEDEGIYSPLFAEAFAAKLAFYAALPLTGSNQKQQAALALHMGLIKTAKSRDGMQSTTRRMRNKTLLHSR